MSGVGPLAGYDDWPAFLVEAPLRDIMEPARAGLAAVLGVRSAVATDLRIEREWLADGVRGRELSWRLPFGPRTRAWLLEPERHDGGLPGLLAMHCHGGVRSTGGEQLVDTGVVPHESAARLRASVYDGRVPANDLAREGFAVLAHDTFSWGSRAFDLSAPTPRLAGAIAAQEALWREQGRDPSPAERFDAASSLHEDSLAKAAGALGTSLAGAVLTDDLVALDLLAAWPTVDADRLGTFGLSGGGARACLLGALDDRVRAVVVTCMMATFASIVPAELDTHSWLLNSPGLWGYCDWPDVTGIGGDRATLVQFGSHDPLFPSDGMRAAHARLLALHAPGTYRGEFYDAGHVCSAAMQRDAAGFLVAALGAAGSPPGGDRSTGRDR